MTAPPAAGAPAVDADDVHRAARRLDGVAHRTPVLTSSTLDAATGARLFLKAEHLQRIGAFKFRGAYNAISSLTPEERARGVVTFSSGNHGQAVARAAALLGVGATVVMPADAPPVKLAATRGYDAEVVTFDRYRDDRHAVAEAVQRERGAVLVPPYDDPTVIAGQGTAALELLEDVDDLDLLVTPVGGGGLLAGCAVAARSREPGIELVGVEPGARHAARNAVAAGHVVEGEIPVTICDGQQSRSIGEHPLAVFVHFGVRVVGVDDDAVRETVRTLALRCKQVVEPSGASALAAVLSGALPVAGRRVGVILSGGNIAPEVLAGILTGAAPDDAERR